MPSLSMKKKRFAFIISDFYGGGAQKVLLNTADGLQKSGHEIQIFTLREKIEHESPEGLNITNLAVINKLTKALSTTLLEKWQASKISSALDSYKPDVVISCSCDRITRHLDIKNLYFWIHGNSTDRVDNEKKLKKKINRLRRFYMNEKVIVVSEGIRESLIRNAGLNPDDITVIYNPFDKASITRASSEDEKAPYTEYFLHVGTFEHRKRHDRLLRAYKESKTNTPLVLMGKGKADEESRIIATINELGLSSQVTILSYRKNPYPIIRKAKSLILTSDREGLPTVLIEALILHTPVISVDCPSGPAEILTDENSKFLVPLKDEKALATAIQEMDRHPQTIYEKHYYKFLKESVLPKFEAL